MSRGQASLHCGNVTMQWTNFVDAMLFSVHCGVFQVMVSSGDYASLPTLNRVITFAKTTASFSTGNMEDRPGII